MDNLFDFIRKYSSQFRSEVSDNLMCTICGNVLIDTHYSHCGCKFCKECIAKYLSDVDKPCPSRKKTCTDAILSLSKDVKKDSYSDTQIGNLLVTCPFDLCSHQCVMKMMPDHVRTCSKQPTVCDFSTVGCEEIMAGEEGLENHLADANVNHLRLLLAYLSNSGNDMQQQMDAIKRHLVDIDNSNERKYHNWRIQSNNLLGVLSADLKQEIEQMKVEEQCTVNEIDGEIGKMKENMERQMTAIKAVSKKTILNSWMTFMIFALVVLFVALVISALRQGNIKETNILLKQLEENLLSVSQQIVTKETNIRTEMQQLKERLRNYEFVWRVDDLTEKRKNNEQIYSDYFYSDLKGYKIRLILYPNGESTGKGTYLSLFFEIGIGDFDSSLQWPMNKRVWLSIVNQRTGSDHIKYDFHVKDTDPKYANTFNRLYFFPYSGLGRPQFISWYDLQKATDVLSNDSLIIRCTFTDL